MGEMYAPTWSIDGFEFSGMAPYHRETGEYDENGWAHVVAKETGWVNGAKPRTNRVAKSGTSYGSYRGPASRDERIVTLEGYTYCQTRQARERAEAALAGLCSNPRGLYEFRRQTDVFDQTLYVELDDQPMCDLVTSHEIKWSFQWAAPDPRKVSTYWQQPITGLPTQGTGGLDIDPDFLDFGSPGTSGFAQVGNIGTATAYPLFRIRGPVTNPVVFEPSTGSMLKYTGTVGETDELWINCDVESQRGYPGHGVYLNNANRRGALAITGAWPSVRPDRTGLYQFFAADYNAYASMQVWFRSAWL
jgi:hypothetical protein